MRKSVLSTLVFAGSLILLATYSRANIGVGVNLGKITVDEPLKSGMSFDLPPFTVINTGEEPSNYRVSLSFQKDQPELRPEKNWVKFSPESFFLEPGKAQIVEMRISLPVVTEPGNYFAYLEARPESTQDVKGTSIGVAAATKLYFTVTPGSIFIGIYFKILSFYKNLLPWSNIFLALVAFAIVISILKKYIRLEIKTAPAKSVQSPSEVKTNYQQPDRKVDRPDLSSSQELIQENPKLPEKNFETKIYEDTTNESSVENLSNKMESIVSEERPVTVKKRNLKTTTKRSSKSPAKKTTKKKTAKKEPAVPKEKL